jgi:Transglutaminase-like superfamily
MERLFKFLRLSWPERMLLIEATILLAAIRIGLRVVPFATLRRLLGLVSRPRSGVREPHDRGKERTLWAVDTAGQHFPAIGTCLMRAMAAHVLLARNGHSSNLRIGVRRDSSGTFDAHAWLEKDGVILIGNTGHANYTPMPALNGLSG